MELLEMTYNLIQERIEHCKMLKNHIKKLQKIKNQQVIVEGSYDTQLTNWRRCKRIINNLRDNASENREQEIAELKETFLPDIDKMIESCEKSIKDLSSDKKKAVNQESDEIMIPKINESINRLNETRKELLNFN